MDPITLAAIGILATTVVSAVGYVVYWAVNPHQLVGGEPIKLLPPETAEDKYWRGLREARALALKEWDDAWHVKHGPGIRENRQRALEANPYSPTFTQVYGMHIHPQQQLLARQQYLIDTLGPEWASTEFAKNYLNSPMSGFQAAQLAQQQPLPLYSPLGYSQPRLPGDLAVLAAKKEKEYREWFKETSK